MLQTLFDIFLLRDFHVSVQRKAWLLFTSLLLGVAIFIHVGDFTTSFLTDSWLLILIVFLSLSLLTGLVRFLVVSTYRGRSQLPVHEQDNFTLGVDALGRTVVAVGTLGSILPIFNIAFSQFLTSFSLVAVATVLIFKDDINNFLSGFRLMFSSDFWVGDYIKVNDNSRGVIRSITFHSTKLKTDDGNILFIPNTQLVSGEVINFSKLKLKRITVPFTVAVEILRPVEDFENILVEKLVAEFGEKVEPEKVFLRINSLDEEKSECTLEISVDHYSFKIEKEITKFVYKIVMERTQVTAK